MRTLWQTHSDARLHIWGLMRHMPVGKVELVEAGMLARPTHRAAMNKLSRLVGTISHSLYPERVYRTSTVTDGLLQIERTA